jgi:hypothetical protein
MDPVGFVEENPMSFNRYLYVNNNPYRYTDPYGESKKLVSEAVKVVGNNIVSLGRASQEMAVKIRRNGGDLRSNPKNAKNIERAAFPGKNQTRPEQHELSNGQMGDPHIHTKSNKKGKREAGHHFTNGVLGGLAVGLEAIGQGLISSGEFMQNIENNMPNTMGLLDVLDPVGIAEDVMQRESNDFDKET